MPAAFRSHIAAGAALMGAGVITAAQLVPPLNNDETRVVQAAVSLAAAVAPPCTGYLTEGCDIWATPTYTPVALDTSGSAANIPANLVNAVVSIPRAIVDAINDLSYALEVTGNWWVYTPVNVLGFDPADPPKITALANLVIPFKPVSNAVGEHLAWWARANLPMNAGCTGSVGPACADPNAILGDMFLAPIWTLASGYQFPELYNPVSDAEAYWGEEVPDSVGEKVPWSGASVKLDLFDPLKAVVNYLLADPTVNTPKPVTVPEISATLDRLGKALVLAFNPIVPRSFLLKGWPYTVLTPLFLPLVPKFCPTCDPENPGGPPITEQVPPAASTATPAGAEVPTPQPAISESGSAAAVAVSASAVDRGDAGTPLGVDADRRVADEPAAADPVPALVPDSGPAADRAADARPGVKQRRGANGSGENARGTAARAAAAAQSGEQAGE